MVASRFKMRPSLRAVRAVTLSPACRRGNIFGIGGQPQFIFGVHARQSGGSEADAIELHRRNLIQPGSDQALLAESPALMANLSRCAASE